MRITNLLVLAGLVVASLGANLISTQQTAYAATIPHHSVTDHSFANGITQAPRWSYLSTMRGDSSSNSVKIYAERVITYSSNPYISVATYSCTPGSHLRTSNVINLRTGTSGYLTKNRGCFRLMMIDLATGKQSEADFKGTITYTVYD